MIIENFKGILEYEDFFVRVCTSIGIININGATIVDTKYDKIATDNYYSEKNKYLSVDVVPDISVHDDAAFVSQLTAELQPLVPNQQVVIVVDHNYTE